jgi:hypothetical protein
LIALPPTALPALRQVFQPDQGTQIAVCLDRLGLCGGSAVEFRGPPALAARVRICTGDRARLVETTGAGPVAPIDRPALVVAADEVAGLDLPAHLVHRASTGYRNLRFGELIGSALCFELRDYLTARRQEYLVVVEPARVDAELARLPGPMFR